MNAIDKICSTRYAHLGKHAYSVMARGKIFASVPAQTMILVFILCFIRRRFLAFLSLLLVNSSFWAFVYIWNTLESRSLSYYGPHLRHRPRWSTVVFRFVCVNFDYPPQIRVFWAWSYLSKPLYLYKSKDIRFPLGVSSSALFAKFDALFWLTFSLDIDQILPWRV